MTTVSSFVPTGFGEQIFKQRYASHPGETWEEACRRIASFIAGAERNGKRIEWEERFFKELVTNRFIPGGRIMYGAGRAKAALINCFVIGSDNIDSREGWAKNLGDMLVISGLGGGVGINFSDIRPRGTPIHGTGGSSTGSVSYMELINSVGEVIKGGGGRRSALMECLNIDHPDIIEFIDKKFVELNLDFNNSDEVLSFVKKNLQVFDSTVLSLIDKICDPDSPQLAKDILKAMIKISLEKNLRNANVSVVFNDDPEKFFEKVKNKEMHQFKWKGHVVSEMRADKLWDKIISNALSGGEPGILNMYLANKASNISNVGPVVSTNPCITDDSWIHTTDGPRQVKDLIGKKFTALVDGKPFDSTDEGFFYKGEKEVVLVTLDNGVELKCTPDHKVLSVLEDGTEKMIPVSEIGIGGTVKLQNQRGSEWSGKGSFEEGWLLGSLIGDGTFGSFNSIEESVDYAKLTYWGEEKEEMYQRAVGYVTSNYGDYNGRFAKSSTENSYNKNLSLQSAPLMRFALGFGITRNNKRITETFEKEASSEAYKGLLRGLFDADGSVQGSSERGFTVRLSSSDLENLKGVQRSLGRLGILSLLYLNRRPAQNRMLPDGKGGLKEYFCKAQHELAISKDNLVEFSKVVGFSEQGKQSKLEAVLKSSNRKVEKFVRKIKSIEFAGTEKVYDCSIPGPNRFDCNTVTISNCGEIAMTPHEVCDLAHIVLPRFIKDNGQMDWALLADTVTVGIRFLDNVLDVTTYPTEEIKAKATNTRRLGLGITGLHDALLKMGIKYSSEEGRDVAAKIMKFVKNKSYEESVFLAAERGVYGFYDHEAVKQSTTYKTLKPSVRHQIDERGLRNCAVNTIAPCGTNSIVSGVSSSAEPIMGPAYKRMWWVGDEKHSEIVIHPLFEQFVTEGKDVSHFEYSEEIDPRDHFKMQVALQEHIDNAISKTIAIPKNYSKKRFSEDLMEFMPHLKGVTIYPVGSRGESPIQPLHIDEAIKVVKERRGITGTSIEQETQDCPSGVCTLG